MEITSVNAGQDRTRNATFIKTNLYGICLQKVVNGQGQESAKVLLKDTNEIHKHFHSFNWILWLHTINVWDLPGSHRMVWRENNA